MARDRTTPPYPSNPGPRRGQTALLLSLLLLLLPRGLPANGGTLRFVGLLGPWEVAVFTDPTPPRPDSLDVSILATLPGSIHPVEDLEITVRLEEVSGRGTHQLPATREQAEDPRYYAAKFRDLGAGEWRVTVAARGPTSEGGEAGFTLRVREPGAAEHPLVLFLLALLPLFAMGWWLRGGPRRPHPGDG